MINESKDDICCMCSEKTSAGLVTSLGNPICKTCHKLMEKKTVDVIKQAPRTQALKEAKEILVEKYEKSVYEKAGAATNEQFQYFLGAEEALEEVIGKLDELLGQ